MTFRFTLSHTDPDTEITDSQVIDPPDGWEDAVLKLERDENFHSLVEHFEGEFTFYGTDNDVNGGIDFIKEKERDFGPDATIKILIEIAPDDETFETVFEGQLDLASKEEFWDNTMQVGIIRDDFWAKFINRLETPVNLLGKGVDGEDINLYDPVGVKLTSQLLQQISNHYSAESYNIGTDLDIAENDYFQLDFDTTELDEIQTKFNYPVTFNTERPFELLALEYGGTYEFDIRVVFAARGNYLGTGDFWAPALDGSSLSNYPVIKVYFQINDDTPIEMGAFPTNYLGAFVTVYEHQSTQSLNKGDFVRVYGQLDSATGATSRYWLLGQVIPSTINNSISKPPFAHIATDGTADTHFRVTAQTIHPETVAEGFLIHDILAAISNRIIGRNDTFFSEYLGSQFTKTRVYPDDGCGWFYVGIKGLQIRLYTLAEKPFFMSFKQAWDGINPILNLGLGYELIDPSAADEPTVADFNDGANLGSGENWQLLPGPLRYEVVLTLFQSSKLLAFEIDGGVEGATYEIGWDITIDDTLGTRIALWDAALTETTSQLILRSAGNHQGTVSLVPGFIPKYVTFSSGSIGGGEWHIHPFTFDVTLPDSSNSIPVIRVEEKSHFYDDSSTSVDFSNVLNITKNYDHEHQFNQVEIGYQKWNAEDVSGLDDPQTKHVYATRFKKIGQKISLLSQWIAASLTIEVTRRTTREKSADYKYDNDTFIIAVNPVPTDVSPETSPDYVDFAPELDENFSSVENLQNSDTRYNLRLTPARNLLRWINYLSGCLQEYLSSAFRFSSGEGNFDMESVMIDSSPDCQDRADNEGDELSEKENIAVSSDYLFIPEPLNITGLPMEWEDYKALRASKKKAIGISQGNSEFAKCFIKSLDYNIVSSQADLVVWPKERFDIKIIETVPDMQCALSEASGGGDEIFHILLETGDSLITEDNGLVLVED